MLPLVPPSLSLFSFFFFLMSLFSTLKQEGNCPHFPASLATGQFCFITLCEASGLSIQELTIYNTQPGNAEG